MTRLEFIVRNLFSHFRGNLAVLLGAAVGASVLTGALLVGDSLRGSLRDRTARQLQLGHVDCVLVGGRFLRTGLAKQLPGAVRPAIMLQGAVDAGSAQNERHAGQVTVWGVDSRFGIDRPELDEDKAVAILSTNLARALKADVGSTIVASVPKASVMPRSSILARRGIDDTTLKIDLTVAAILSDADPANALSLAISPTLPSNMFIPIAHLQQLIKQEGKANAFLASGEPSQSLQSAFREHLTLEDWGLKVFVAPYRKSYVSLESSQLLLQPAVVEVAEAAAKEVGLRTAKTYVYLANTIVHGESDVPYSAVAAGLGAPAVTVWNNSYEGIPYSIVAALDPTEAPPLGKFLPDDVAELKPGEIVLAQWQGSPIKMTANGDQTITLRYFRPEVEGRMEEAQHSFRFRGYIGLNGGVADDRDLTPAFPGITDRATLATWDPPFEISTKRIKPSDEAYWKKHRATPKAFIRLDDGQKLWGTRFGDVTSIRIAPKPGESLDSARERFANELLKELDPKSGGMIFQPIRQRMLDASQGPNDFGMLFLCFSFFLIVAALMLVGLLFRLNLDRRAGEIGLLRATGFPLKTVRWLLLVEGLLLAAVGSLIGLAGAVLYADGMIRLLVALWPTPGVEAYLTLHVTALSLAIGFFSAVLMSGLAILWALRSLSKVAPSQLLKGDMTPASASGPAKVSTWPIVAAIVSVWPIVVAIASTVVAIGLAAVGPFAPPGEAQAKCFFFSGGLLLTAGLCLVWAWLKRTRRHLVSGHGASTLARLGVRNASRNPTRSLLTTGLLASAAFLLVAVESFRREPERDFLEKNGGSGGFYLMAQAATPIDFDLNDKDGRKQIEEKLERHYQDIGFDQKQKEERTAQEMALLQDVDFYRFRLQRGDDASCLNLYQATRPRLLGVPQSIIERGGFTFADSLATKKDASNPWRLLAWQDNAKADNEPIPCMVEMNTATWMLHKDLGDTFEMPDEQNKPMTLRIVGLLQDSVFQSEVLVPDAAFRRHFPHTEGFGYFLIDVPPQKADEVSRVLTKALSRYGFETTRTRDRVAAYLAVQNTYLSTFQLLGGFGLLLGVLGLSVVLLRSIWERRAELALLRALGYRERALNEIVLAENGLLLLLGLAAGVVAALASIAPHMAMGGHVPWGTLGIMLGLVLVVGLAVAFGAIVATLRAPLIPALREE